MSASPQSGPRVFPQPPSPPSPSDASGGGSDGAAAVSTANPISPSLEGQPAFRPSLLVPPSTVVSPPTPIEPPSSGVTLSFASQLPSTLLEADEIQYDSPDEDDDESSILPTPPSAPYATLGGGGSTSSMPISKTSMSSMASSSSRGDESSYMSPPTSYHGSLPSSSPHLFAEKGRIPSPSSPQYGPTAGKLRQHHRRQSSQHRVRETIYAEERNSIDGARLINQYRIGKPLGRGAYATVSLALDVGTGIQYAMKEFSKSRLQHQVLMARQQKAARDRRNRRRPQRSGPATVQSGEGTSSDNSRNNSVDEETLMQDPLALIRREIAVMKKLDHPNLTHLYEAISVPNADSLLLILEYLPGGVLMDIKAGEDDHDARSPFSDDQAREYFRQICLGLEYLHANGVVHRDIKPDNILFNSDRSMVKLADFGVSEMFQTSGDDTLRGVGGSPAFLSPESLGGPASDIHGKPVDIWALGVTFYCMLTGKLPFNYADPIVLIQMVKTKEPEIPEEWHPDLQALVKGMLNKDPDQRYTMTNIRENLWVIDWGVQPMLTVEDNLFYFGQVFSEPTSEEVRSAITSLRSVFTVVRAVKKMQALSNTRRLLSGRNFFTAGDAANIRSGLPSAERQSSIDSYHLPEAVTAEEGSGDHEDRENTIHCESPTSAVPVSEQPNPFDSLSPIKTGLASAEEDPSVVMSSSPQEVSSPVMLASSPIAESPGRVASPVPFESPREMASPLPCESPSMVDSPGRVESPVPCESPSMVDSPGRVEAPVPFDSPVEFASPLMATPPRVPSPPLVHSSPIAIPSPRR